jgi:hypothetical protein
MAGDRVRAGEYAERINAADHPLTVVEKQAAWADPGLRPSPVMVRLPEATGAFLDAIEGERLAALSSGLSWQQRQAPLLLHVQPRCTHELSLRVVHARASRTGWPLP